MGARLRSMHRISLGADARTIELSHPGEAVYYVIDGDGSVLDADAGERHRADRGLDGARRRRARAYALAAGGDGHGARRRAVPGGPALYDGTVADVAVRVFHRDQPDQGCR